MSQGENDQSHDQSRGNRGDNPDDQTHWPAPRVRRRDRRDKPGKRPAPRIKSNAQIHDECMSVAGPEHIEQLWSSVTSAHKLHAEYMQELTESNLTGSFAFHESKGHKEILERRMEELNDAQRSARYAEVALTSAERGAESSVVNALYALDRRRRRRRLTEQAAEPADDEAPAAEYD